MNVEKVVESEFLYAFLLIGLFAMIIQLFQYLSKITNIPQVVGEITAGVIVGPSLFNLISLNLENSSSLVEVGLFSSHDLEISIIVIKFLSEIAALFLLFEVGLELNVRLLRSVGKESLLSAMGGILLPFISGILFILLFDSYLGIEGIPLEDTALFMGVTLTATSIGISIRVLIELRQFDTRTTRIMIGAAIIDDILALIFFAMVTGYVEQDTLDAPPSAVIIMGSIVIFFIIGFVLNSLFNKFATKRLVLHQDKYLVLSFVMTLIFLLSFLAGELFLSPIIGAFTAGIIIGRNEELTDKALEEFTPIARWLVPFFFLAVGLQFDLNLISDFTTILLTLVLTFISIVTKVIGAGIGAIVNDHTNNKADALQVGLGMAPRGEVVLLISSAALSFGIFSERLFAITVAMVIITALIVPILLRILIHKRIDTTLNSDIGL